MRVRVWAPHAGRVDVVADHDRVAMRPAGSGWYEGEIGSGEYAFSLDGGPARPDPRSRSQPRGVHGPSAALDARALEWTDGGWAGFPLRDAVIYELHVGTFTPEGTFDAAIGRLAHLVDLGVNAVELMPVAEFTGRRGWGYDGVDVYAPHHAYGGPAGLARFVDACHGRGLAVVLDVVYNHLGPDGNYLAEFGPYFTHRHRTPWGQALNFDDRGADEVRGFVLDNAEMWLRDYHLDGLRLDAVHEIFDRSATHLLEELAERKEGLERELGRRLWLVAESDLNDPRLVRERGRGGYGLDATWSDDLHHALHVALTGERTGFYADYSGLGDAAKALRGTYVYHGQRSAFRGRRHGRSASDVAADRFVAFLQNHDQIGNRAGGERISHLAPLGAVQAAAALVLLGPAVPLVFQGEEWAASTPFLYFTDHVDRDLARLVSDGRRHEFAAFGWPPSDVPDPQAHGTFERSRLRWEERHDSPHREVHDWYRTLIGLRRALPSLRDGDRSAVGVEHGEGGWLRLTRDALVVACNFGRRPVQVPLSGDWRLEAGCTEGIDVGEGAVGLPPESAAVLRQPAASRSAASSARSNSGAKMK